MSKIYGINHSDIRGHNADLMITDGLDKESNPNRLIYLKQPTYVRNVVHAIKEASNHNVTRVRNALGHTEWSIDRKLSDEKFWQQLGALPNPSLQRVYQILNEG